jgi:hypothetical protein
MQSARTNQKVANRLKVARKKSSAASKRKPAPRAKSAKSTNKKSSTSKPLGIYTVPRGDVSVPVPAFWGFRQTNDDLQLVAPSGDVSVIITAYAKSNGMRSLDSRESLEYLLASAPNLSKLKREPATKKRAGARYVDADGNSWWVEFITNGKTLLLGEVSSTGPLRGPEAKAAVKILQDLKLKGAR